LKFGWAEASGMLHMKVLLSRFFVGAVDRTS
jgi:hypothetical protein